MLCGNGLKNNQIFRHEAQNLKQYVSRCDVLKFHVYHPEVFEVVILSFKLRLCSFFRFL